MVILKGLPEGEKDREEQVTGPPARVAWDDDGNPTKALEGFARRLGLEPSEVQRVETDKGEYAGARQTIRGRSTAEALAEIVPEVLHDIPWPKTMRWGTGQGPWVRPVHGVVSLLDGEVVPFELFGVAAGTATAGHPVLSPEAIEVADAAGYRKALGERSLVVDPAGALETPLGGDGRACEAGRRLAGRGPGPARQAHRHGGDPRRDGGELPGRLPGRFPGRC